MPQKRSYDGRVAVITGAGGGLGRAHALLLAARGAKVVVNDLGGSFTGEGSSQRAADRVVAEIREAGGEAVANYDSVEDGEAIVKTAIDAYGRIDILVNNAGILRDVSFHKMTQVDWDLIYQVHLLGSFRVTHAAWPLMREQGYGRVVMTTSAAGIYGNFGQANYSAAKLALVGLANTLAIEGRKRNILVNTIAPVAGSRMTETILPKNVIDALEPRYVSPLVAWLCHEDSEETGGLFEVGGGFLAKLRWERSVGKLVRLGRDIAIEDVDRHWQAITSFERTTHPDSLMAALQPVMANIEAGPSKGGNQFIDVDEALGYEYPEITTTHDERDVALYALGVGSATDPIDDRDLQLVYEMHGEGMKVLPTYGVVPAVNALVTFVQRGEQAPGLDYGFDRLLHGEQYTEVTRPLPRRATLTHRARIKDIFDKGKHALIVNEVKSYDEAGDLLVNNELTFLIRGAGGWGGERGPSDEVNTPPDRAPDHVTREVVPANQALLYRLSGDWNPLHADPGFARAVGFERPILHGLCTFGYAGRHVIAAFAPDGDPRHFKSIKVRFAASVTPGETLVTEMWRESDTRIVFRCKALERDTVVVSNAAVELFAEIPKPRAKKPAQPTGKPEATANADAPAEPTSWDVFVAIRDHVERHPELIDRVGFVFLFQLTDPASSWTLDLKTAPGAVTEGQTQKPDCTLAISDADFLAMTRGEADPMKLFTTGKLRVSGNVMASQKLEFLQKIDPDHARDAVARARAAGHGPGEPAAAGDAARAEERALQAPAIFAALGERLGANPELGAEVAAVVGFRIGDPAETRPDAPPPRGSWLLELTGDAPSIREGAADDGADAVLTIADDDLVALVRGEVTAGELFQKGKLRVDGDVSVARRLGFMRGLI